MRRYEIILKEITRPKLTVSVDRVTLKIPAIYDVDYHVFAALCQEMESMRTPVTVRGRFKITDQIVHLASENGDKTLTVSVSGLLHPRSP